MTTLEKIRTLMVDSCCIDEDQEVNAESDLFNDLLFDSLYIVNLVMAIEEEFEIQILDSDYEQMKTVADVVRFIDEQAPK